MPSNVKMQKLWITFLHGGRNVGYTNSTNMQAIYFTKITRLGNSCAVVIPVNILNAYNWQRGDTLVFGFLGTDQLFLKRLTDKDMERLKSNEVIPLD